MIFSCSLDKLDENLVFINKNEEANKLKINLNETYSMFVFIASSRNKSHLNLNKCPPIKINNIVIPHVQSVKNFWDVLNFPEIIVE